MLRRRSLRYVVLAVAVAAAAAGVVHAQGRASKGEQTLKYRKAIYQTMVLAVPSYQFEAMSRSIRRSNGRWR